MWGKPIDPMKEWKRKHLPIEKFYNPNWPPYQAESEIPQRITDIMTSYHEYVKDKSILLMSASDPTNHISKPYNVRGTEVYESNTKKRIYDIRREWDRRPEGKRAMLITISPRQVGSVLTLHRQMKALWPKFTDWLRHRYPYSMSIWSAEPNKRHYTHYHMVVNGIHVKGIMAQRILKWWRGHGVDIENAGVEVERCKKHPCGYALKYVSKGSKDLFWQGILWMGGGRIWGASRGLGRPPLTKSETKWTYCGVCGTEWFAKYRKDLVWGDVLPEKLVSDLAEREKYYSDVY